MRFAITLSAVLGASACASTIGGVVASTDASLDASPGDAPDAPATDAPPSLGRPITAAEVARACLLAVGCSPSPIARVGACVLGLSRRALNPHGTGEDAWDRLLECASRPGTSSSCTAFVECATMGHPAAYCAAHPGDSCDGSIAVHCAEAALAAAEDCAAIPGGSCEATAIGASALVHCAAPGTCSTRCAGAGAFVDCGGAPGSYAARCTPGTTCVEAPSSVPIAACLPTGSACAAEGARCDGAALVRCQGVNGTALRETRIDCARLGWRCAEGAEGFACLAPPFACALDVPTACEGDTLVACAGGANPRFDCRALGFARCAPAAGGRPARCEP